MLFHMVDRIDSLVPGRSIIARKLLSRTENYRRWGADDHRAPGGLLLESLCQAGTWLVLASTEFARSGALVSVDEITCHGEAGPGDVLSLRGEVDAMGDQVAVLSGTVSVDGRAVLTARNILCALLPAASLEDPVDTRRRFERLRGQELPR